MIINVKVIPRSKKERIKNESGGLKVYVTAPPEGGRANEAALKFLARHFCTAKSKIQIIKGEKSREKTILIED